MKFVHIGDCHIGKRQYGLIQRELDIENAITRVVDYAVKKANSIKVFIWPGDVFDGPRPRASSVSFLKRQVSRLKKAGVRSLGVDGNHDPAENMWLNLVGIETFEPGEVVEIDHIRFTGLNFTVPSKLEAALDVTRGGRFDVMIMHQALAEAANFDGVATTADRLTELLSPAGVRYLAMGDIHKEYNKEHNGVTVCYPGSVEVISSDEDWDKHFTVVEITESKLSHHKEPIPTRNTRLVKITSDEDIEKLAVTVSEDLESFFYVEVSRAVSDGAARCKQVLKDSLFRVESVSAEVADSVEMHIVQWERQTTIVDIEKAVESSYASDTDEYSLILSCIANPGDLKDIFDTYLKEKKIT